MQTRSGQGGRFLFLLLLLGVGAAGGWWLRGWMSRVDTTASTPVTPVGHDDGGRHDDAPPTIAPKESAPTIGPTRPDTGDLIADLRQRRLRVPLDGADTALFKGQFDQRRGGGSRGHEAVDLLAPRNTPIYAVDAGTIAKLFVSKAGGNTVYQFDEEGRACFYYAHLERYADGLTEGQRIRAGELLGYVGTTGNAPPDTPHLHFAVFKLTPEKQWWKGEAIDPSLVFEGH